MVCIYVHVLFSSKSSLKHSSFENTLGVVQLYILMHNIPFVGYLCSKWTSWILVNWLHSVLC